MNKSSLKYLLISAVTSLALASNVAVAHKAGKANNSYVGDSNKHLISDSQGSCVRTGAWKKADMTVDCGAPVMKAEPAPPPPPAPPAEPMYETVTLSASALFDFDKAVLKPAGKQALDDVVTKINETNNVQAIKVVGHTDSIGTEAYNQQLSLRRATSVKNYLVSKGIASGLMTIIGMGESSPAASNKTREGRAKNRRVEVSIGVKRQAN